MGRAQSTAFAGLGLAWWTALAAVTGAPVNAAYQGASSSFAMRSCGSSTLARTVSMPMTEGASDPLVKDDAAVSSRQLLYRYTYIDTTPDSCKNTFCTGTGDRDTFKAEDECFGSCKEGFDDCCCQCKITKTTFWCLVTIIPAVLICAVVSYCAKLRKCIANRQANAQHPAYPGEHQQYGMAVGAPPPPPPANQGIDARAAGFVPYGKSAAPAVIEDPVSDLAHVTGSREQAHRLLAATNGDVNAAAQMHFDGLYNQSSVHAPGQPTKPPPAPPAYPALYQG